MGKKENKKVVKSWEERWRERKIFREECYKKRKVFKQVA